MTPALLTVLLLAATISAGEPTNQSAQLRALLRYPSSSATWNPKIEVLPRYGYVLGIVDWQKEIAKAKELSAREPENAEHLLVLGELYPKVDDIPSTIDVYAKAVKLLRSQLASREDDPKLCLLLAEALLSGSHLKDGEAALDKAKELGDESWRLWSLRGKYKLRQAFIILLGEGFSANNRNLCQRIDKHAPTPADFKRALDLSHEAKALADKAVSLGRDETRAYMDRNAWRELHSAITACADQTNGKNIPNGDTPPALFTAEAIGDARQVARLHPSDFNAQAAAAILQLAAYLRGDTPTSQGIEAIDTFIDSFKDSPDKEAAAIVAEVSGIVELALRHDLRWAERDFRRAVSLDKSREPSWDFLSGVLSTQKRWSDLRDICQERTRQADTTAARTLLFAALVGLKENDAAIEQGRIAVKMSPGDFNTHWRLGIALLGTDNKIIEANRELDMALKLSNDASPRERSDLELTRVIGLALAGNRKGALQLLAKTEASGLTLDAQRVQTLQEILGDNK